MTRAELIASLVPSALAGICADPECIDGEKIAKFACNVSEDTADEMIRRGIVTVSDAPKEGQA